MIAARLFAIGVRSPESAGKAVGIAFKMEDGSARARDAVALDLLTRLGLFPPAARRALEVYRSPILRNVRGQDVGRIEAEVPLQRT